MGYQREKALEMLSQVVELGNGTLLGSHQVRVAGQDGLHHQLFAVLPVVGAIQRVSEPEVEGKYAHMLASGEL
jgi:hypothetical protein